MKINEIEKIIDPVILERGFDYCNSRAVIELKKLVT